MDAGKTPNQKEADKGDRAMYGDFVKVKQMPAAQTEAMPSETSGGMARYVGEEVQSAVGLATGMLQYSKEIVVESARPAYWEADADITHCNKCKVKFDPADYPLHQASLLSLWEMILPIAAFLTERW